jgi:hypothetical protein
VAVASTGWYVSHRNQKNLFRIQVRNTARGEIVSALRKRQDYISKLSNIIAPLVIGWKDGSSTFWGEGRWRDAVSKYASLNSDDAALWILRLEEYEVVFPKTTKCRLELVGRSIETTTDIAQFFIALREPATRHDAIVSAEGLHDRLEDENALTEDLLIYVQNEALGSVFGVRAPFRRPPDQRVVRIVVGAGGNLEIVGGHNG